MKAIDVNMLNIIMICNCCTQHYAQCTKGIKTDVIQILMITRDIATHFVTTQMQNTTKKLYNYARTSHKN